MLEITRQLKNSHQILINLHRVAIPYPLKLEMGMYSCPTTTCTNNFENKLVEIHFYPYNVERGRVDYLKGTLKK
jgi:hypothetical protein